MSVSTNYSPILIGRCGSSGTSLLSHLLNAHSAIYCGAELFLFNKKILYSLPFTTVKDEFKFFLRKGVPTSGLLDCDLLGLSTYTQPRRGLTFLYNLKDYGVDPSVLINILKQSNNIKEFTDSFFQIVLLKEGKRRWAEKTPTNCYCISDFLSLYPSGKYIHVVRDGRDVVASLVQRGTPPEIAVRRWIHDTSMGIPHRGDNRYFELRYEDLVCEPEPTLSKLMNFLEEESEVESMLSSHGRSKLMNSHNTWSAQPTGAISKKALAKWKKQDYPHKLYIEQLFHHTKLTKEVSHQLDLNGEPNANDILLKFGYDASDNWNQEPVRTWRISFHWFQEEVCKLLRPQKIYCKVSL